MKNEMKGEGTHQENFLRAHELYMSKNYEQALALYQTIPEKGSAVWYNMGNCAYQLGDYADALLYWKRAEREATGVQRADILYNIQALGKKINVPYEKNNAFVDAGTTWLLGTPLIFMQLFFLTGWIGLWAYIKRWHTKERYLLLYFLIGLNSFFGFALIYRLMYAHRCTAIIATPQAPVYAGPDSRYHTVGSLNAVTECKVKQLCGDWCKIRTGSLVGWVKKDHCELV